MPDLPPPWRAEKDPSTGATYYWNTETNETSWEPPKAANGAPPAGGGANGAYSSRDLYAPADLAKAHKSTSDPADVASWRKEHEVAVSAGCPDPYLRFEDANLPPQLFAEVQRAGFPTPSPIQAQAWPPALGGHDIVGIAKTGSGKTLAFLMPAFMQIMQRRPDPRRGPYALVLAPTRELATQILDECSKFGRSAGMTATCCYGGSPKGAQLRDLQRGVYLVIATPGRLNDFLEARQVNLGAVGYLVLDEADRMLDMGFEPQIRRIVACLPRERQTLMFTATWPKEVVRLASEFQKTPYQITIGSGGDRPTANKDIVQQVELTPTLFDKERRLMDTLMKYGGPGVRVLIFCSTKRMCDDLCTALRRQIPCNAIHGDKEQRERERVLFEFKSGRAPILIATDVAARGLDVKDVRMVINYDFPSNTEDYIHRIGRTGRAGQTGTAITFMGPQDAKHARALVKIMTEANQEISPELEQMAASAPAGGGGGGGRFARGGRGGG
eukprot:CAMPEP_0206035390 /NCGR_PEP_ID=MMETSP1466-20131121/2044_1 /ASSEMBLY_ACC=CAM_ASM_001126 /TAXON_ID=44452 /ORGANISM="Pavlova gyrans, Strain CCMP608" /LENGTH=498 /DNA_ID=CAMNT_0053409769 /DNA_START=99 /DNA_END=1591 /DNA_ORIENTATION=+